MLPVIMAGVAIVGAGIWILNELQEQASVERERWRAKKDEVQREVEWHRQQIEIRLNDAQDAYNFKVLVDMHYSCVQVANQAYLLLKDARITIDKISEAIVKTKEQRGLLFARKKSAKNSAERTEIQNEITSIQELRRKLFDDMNAIKQQEESFRLRVKELNNKTRMLKINIRDQTGNRGREWYARLEARKLQ